MEGFGHIQTVNQACKGLVVAVVIVGVSALAPGARADHHYRDVTSSASSNKAGVDFSIREVNSQSGQATTMATGVQCDLQLQLGNIGQYSGYWKRSPSVTSVLAHRVCTDGTDEFIWVDMCDFMSVDACPSSPTVDPLVLARRVRDNLPVPGFTIASNPRRGLVGLKTWFWVEGGGRPLSDSLSAFGTRVDVEATPVIYRWDFGDGTIKTTRSPGRPYPQRSPVRSMYERSSAGHPDGYRVSVTAVFEVRWRVNGGRWRSLPSISRSFERFYPVAESQAVNSRD